MAYSALLVDEPASSCAFLNTQNSGFRLSNAFTALSLHVLLFLCVDQTVRCLPTVRHSAMTTSHATFIAIWTPTNKTIEMVLMRIYYAFAGFRLLAIFECSYCTMLYRAPHSSESNPCTGPRKVLLY